MCAFGNRLVAALLLTVFATTWLHPSEAHLACTIPHSCCKSVGDASLTRYDSANRCVNGPVVVVIGERHLIKGLDEGLVGKEAGKHSFDIKDVDAFGKKDAKKLQLVPMKLFAKENIRPFAGLQVNIDDTMGIVRSVSGGRVIVDFNHPLSSKDVHYDVEVEGIITDKKEQVQAFFDIMGAKVESISVEGDKAIITTQAPLPEPFTKPLGEDISRLTGIKTIEFANKTASKEVKKPEEKKSE